MFTISVETSFHASHQLGLADGSKEPVHSHEWSVIAKVAAEQLDDFGVVMDFHKLRKELCDIIAPFDNSQLGAVDYFERNSQSAENVAKYIYEKLAARLPKGVRIKGVKVGEERGCWAKYAEEKTVCS
ncbi:MAG: 6-carboxytetrahydropterin synthase [Sedimentisphaerales bacterium]|nr:6-carboxytetrahydropterin synthase [Sedimentisphaerales bacterium]